MKAAASREKSRAVRRNMFPGLSSLSSISKGIYSENADKETIYSSEEKKIFALSKELRDLHESLKSREKDETKT